MIVPELLSPPASNEPSSRIVPLLVRLLAITLPVGELTSSVPAVIANTSLTVSRPLAEISPPGSSRVIEPTVAVSTETTKEPVRSISAVSAEPGTCAGNQFEVVVQLPDTAAAQVKVLIV